MTDSADNIAVGVAGWSYPDWEGYVYPACDKDKLACVAPYLDMIEINSTFYRPPDARTVASWVERTADLPHRRLVGRAHGGDSGVFLRRKTASGRDTRRTDRI